MTTPIQFEKKPEDDTSKEPAAPGADVPKDDQPIDAPAEGEQPPTDETKDDEPPVEGDADPGEEPQEPTDDQPPAEDTPIDGQDEHAPEAETDHPVGQPLDPMVEHTHKLARVTALLGGLAKVVHGHMTNPPVPPVPPEPPKPMKGKQVAALQSIIESVTWGRIPRQAAVAMIVKAFPQITPEEATAMVSPDGVKALAAEEKIEGGEGGDEQPPADDAPPEGDDAPPEEGSDKAPKFDAADAADAAELARIETELTRLVAERTTVEHRIDAIKYVMDAGGADPFEDGRHDYSDDQPRDESGQFASEGGGAGPAAHKVARELLQQSGGDIHYALQPFHGAVVPEHLTAENGDQVPTGEVHAALKSYAPSPPVKNREYVTVHHTTTPEVADMMTRQGVIPEAKPTNLARERFEEGGDAVFGPGRGLSGGVYVGAPGTTSGFGRTTVEMKVPKEWLSIPPELHGIESDPMRALHTEHGAVITKAIHPSLIRKLDPDREATITKGNIGIPRELMPQIAEKDAPEFLESLKAKGVVVHANGEMNVADLKPTQSTMNMEKVEGMTKNMPAHILAKPVIVSSDNHILDGHHRWAALRLNDPAAKIAVHRVDLPIRNLVTEALAFPKAGRRTVKDGVEDEPRDEHGQWTVGGSGGGKVKTATKSEGGVTFETGKPVKMNFMHNTAKSPSTGKYGQDIEPHGRYMLHDTRPSDAAPPGWEKGTVEFKNPLVVPVSDDPKDIYGPTGWKARLHDATGLKGKALSEHLAKRGHDAIITVDKYGTSEIVDLTSFHKNGAPKPEHAALGYTHENLTDFERNNLDDVVQRAKDGGWMRAKEMIGGTRDRAQPAPEGAPKFKPSDAPRGTLMFRDGDRTKPVMVARARAKGPNGEKMAVVANVIRLGGLKGWFHQGHYAIERERLEHGGKHLLDKNRPTTEDIFGKDTK